MRKKIKINLIDEHATLVKGQGVGSSYLEHLKILRKLNPEEFEVHINSQDTDFDIYHYHTFSPFNYLRIRLQKNSNHIVHLHFLPETLDGSIKLVEPLFTILKMYIDHFYQMCPRLVLVNSYYIDSLVKRGFNPEQLVYIPNYVSRAEFFVKTKAEVEYLFDQYHIKRNPFTVLGVGQVLTQKGVFDFVEVAQRLPHITFIWVGGFNFKGFIDKYKDLKDLIKNKPENVFFTGIVDRSVINDFYNLADVFFFPTFKEFFPMCVLEAINTHKPLLLRDLELFKPIFFDKFLKGKNATEFTEEIVQLSTDPQYFEEAVQNTIYLKDYYQESKIIKMYEDLYRSSCNKKF